MGSLNLGESWDFFTTHAMPGRLVQEEPGVKGPLWFGAKDPDNEWHFVINILRIFCAVVLAPLWLIIPPVGPSKNTLLKRLLWGIEWSNTPDAVLWEAPRSIAFGRKSQEENDEGEDEDEEEIGNELLRPLLREPRSNTGNYAVTSKKPQWILVVIFEGNKVISQIQVRFQPKQRDINKHSGSDLSMEEEETIHKARALDRDIHLKGYTALSYAMKSAEVLFHNDKERSLRPQPTKEEMNGRDYSNENRQLISQVVLDEYAKARKTAGEGDGLEYIWLDEYCLHDAPITVDEEAAKPREKEVGHLADIFRNAKRVVVFCHIVNCSHTGMKCPWANRLFTIAEILYTPQVFQMTRSETSDGGISSVITVIPGQEFRADMQNRAAIAKKWHLYNIMQHATNSGAVPWQSAIHSLVVEAIRRDEAGGFNQHRLLGKALNGLLPRRSQLSDLRGQDGWADLAWLLELNQGYYNTALLAAVCKIADPDVKEYRWWGKPIEPREGCERLEPLVTAIPVRLKKSKYHDAQPALSIVGPKALGLGNMLQRDSAGLFNNAEMKPLMWFSFGTFLSLLIISLLTIIISSITGRSRGVTAGVIMMYGTAVVFAIFQLFVGTIFVRKDGWVAIEDHRVPHSDVCRYIQSKDPTFADADEWGPHQMLPQFDLPHPEGPAPRNEVMRPYATTLFDLKTGVFVRAAVTATPNDMVILAVHGSGITCMLLDRDDGTDAVKTSVAAKVGMVNLPTFVIAQSEVSGTVYIGGGPVGKKGSRKEWSWLSSSLTQILAFLNDL